MAKDTSNFKINFGLVAFPYLAEEAMIEGASYRPDSRAEDIKKSITTLKRYFDKHTPKTIPKDESGDSDSIAAVIKMLLDSKTSKNQENETAQKEVR